MVAKSAMFEILALSVACDLAQGHLVSMRFSVFLCKLDTITVSVSQRCWED